MGKTVLPARARRIDAWRIRIELDDGVPCTLFANAEVGIEADAIDQLVRFASLSRAYGGRLGALRRIVLTPDFHRGAGIPVGTVAETQGFVVPAAIGNDVGCGMRLLATDVREDEVLAHRPALEQRLRALFFGGERDIPMSPRQREALLRDGLSGLLRTRGDNAGAGLWRLYDRAREEAALARVHAGGTLPARDVFSFADYIRASGGRDGRDTQIGSVGGGNHFVELQCVDAVPGGSVAHDWGLVRGCVGVMVHTGSVGLGHAVGGHFTSLARQLHPAGVPAPAGAFFALPVAGANATAGVRYLDAMRNAANFAFGNRLFLGLMAVRALSEAVGREVAWRLVADAPHNLVWERGEDVWLHRKGACPALGPKPAEHGPFRYTGHPVLVPGSMGAPSFVLAGCGSEEALDSACHGAGRSLSRGKAGHVDVDRQAALAALRVVTPIDPESRSVRNRRDVLAQYRARLLEEAPFAYKPVTPVIDTIEGAGIARQIARLRPLVTVKG